MAFYLGSTGVQVGLNTHNRYRSIHNAPMMRLTPELNNAAQIYADKLASESKFEHDPNNRGQGENLGLQCPPGSDADLVKKVVDAWWVPRDVTISQLHPVISWIILDSPVEFNFSVALWVASRLRTVSFFS